MPNANLEFWRVVIPRGIIRWHCPLAIGMPLRTQFMGEIPPKRAAKLSVELTDDVARRMDYKLPQGIFCTRFVEQVRETFKSKYPRLGATVAKR